MQSLIMSAEKIASFATPEMIHRELALVDEHEASGALTEHQAGMLRAEYHRALDLLEAAPSCGGLRARGTSDPPDSKE